MEASKDVKVIVECIHCYTLVQSGFEKGVGEHHAAGQTGKEKNECCWKSTQNRKSTCPGGWQQRGPPNI